MIYFCLHLVQMLMSAFLALSMMVPFSFPEQWIRLFDFYSGKCLAKVAGHSELATGVRFTPDGRRLITTGGDRSGCSTMFDHCTSTPQQPKNMSTELSVLRNVDTVHSFSGDCWCKL